MPESPWIMTQTWNDLLFAHWPVDPAVLTARLPRSCTLDLFEGTAWLGIVAFDMSNVAPRFVPALPWLSAFPEINVRTYVRVDDRPGVYFFSLDATNPVAVWFARRFFHLPYHTAAIDTSGMATPSATAAGGATLTPAFKRHTGQQAPPPKRYRGRSSTS